jgi:hypothetical protein
VKSIARRLVRKVIRPRVPQPDWKPVLKQDAARWKSALSSAKGRVPILIATSVGGHLSGTIIESALAVALTLRGAEVHVLLCDQVLPACLYAEFSQFPDLSEFADRGPRGHLCQDCYAPADRMYRSLGVTVHRYSEFIRPEAARSAAELSATIPVSEIGRFGLDGLSVGEHALAGALRFFARGDLDGEPQAEAILRRYFHASLLTVNAVQRLLDTCPFQAACFHHGIYVPQGLVAEVARQRRVRVVNWNPAYRKKCFIFTHHETYHHALLSEPITNWESIPWSEQLEAELMDYLKSRWQGTRDWIWFHERPQEELSKIATDLGIDFSRPCVGMLSNVFWDAQLHYRANAFPNMLDWALRTIRYFATRPDLQLIIRIHPAEIRGTIPSRQPLLAEIQRAFPTLPPNVVVIPPESPISTYATMLACNAVIIYGTKTGVELGSLGIPIIVAGEAWFRNKGLTMDARSAEEYFKLLDQLPLQERLGPEAVVRARKYAYHFFFRRMIPLDCTEPTGEWPPYRLRVSSLDDLLPGRDRGLDAICDGILTGAEFIYPAERMLRGS